MKHLALMCVIAFSLVTSGVGLAVDGALVGDTPPLAGELHQKNDSASFSGEQISVLKELVAVVGHPYRSYIYFFWGDGTCSAFDWDKDQFESLLHICVSVWPDWPAGKRLQSVVMKPDSPDMYFFWTDGTYSQFSWGQNRFVTLHKSVDGWPGWPAGKRLQSVVRKPDSPNMYFFL
ncbi:hypothetical protein ACEUAM_22830 [Aeromonas hydrophila]|uniref:hypothetical protein n=1 Tax=Aeromonas hydrophila TaxID=644 RepID=UPI0038CFC978